MLGQYTHQYTATWARIVKLFERENTFLADCAKNLIQNVKYDIPLYKKQIARLVPGTGLRWHGAAGEMR